MQDQNKTVLNLDDSTKGRKGINEMLKHMEEISNLNEKSDLNVSKETALYKIYTALKNQGGIFN